MSLCVSQDLTMQQIGFFLIGTPASGKGAFGNFIVGNPVFSSDSHTQQTPPQGQICYGLRRDYRIAVAEGPDIATTQQRATNSWQFVQSVENFINAMTGRVYFFLLLLRFGERFTAEDKAMVIFMKAVLGEDLIRKHTFIVMTGGDIFERQYGTGRGPFLSWCNALPEGDLRDLMTESSFRRVHLFGDTSRSEAGLEEQLQQLIRSVDDLRQEPGFVAYNSQNEYNSIIQSRIEAVVTSRKTLIEEETVDSLEQLLPRLDRIRRQLTPADQLLQLASLKRETEQYINRIRIEDRGTSILKPILLRAELADRFVKDAIAVCQNLIQSDNRTCIAERHIVRMRRNQKLIKALLIVFGGIKSYQHFGLKGCCLSLIGACLLCCLSCRFIGESSRVHVYSLLALVVAYFASILFGP